MSRDIWVPPARENARGNCFTSRTSISVHWAVRAFNPSFAHANVDQGFVHKLAALPLFSHISCIVDRLMEELPVYLVACQQSCAYA